MCICANKTGPIEFNLMAWLECYSDQCDICAQFQQKTDKENHELEVMAYIESNKS